MKIRLFVSASAAVLATWLGITYVRDVPHENYQQLDRGSLPVSASTDDGHTDPVELETVARETPVAPRVSPLSDTTGELASTEE